MKLLSSWFRLNRTLGAAILSTALFCTLIAFGTSPKRASAKSDASTSLATAVAVPACPANTIFSASFTGGQAASPQVVQQWKDFIQSLTPAGYNTVTISGTFDSAGRTLTDATV